MNANTQDRQTEHLIRDLINLSYQVRSAREHIVREFALTDGLPTSTPQAAQTYIGKDGKIESVGGGGARSSDDTSPVERTILARAGLASQAAEINDDLDAIEAIIKSCFKTCSRAIGTRTPSTQRCCSSADMAGYKVPLSEGGWHDPLCDRMPRIEGGQCNACRMRYSRYRAKAHPNANPLQPDETIDHDSQIDYVNDVAIVRPLRGAA